MISFTVDLEDPTNVYNSNGRYVTMAQRLLDMCDELKMRATFFVIGRVAGAAPKLIKDIALRGHELAYHSHNHTSLTEEGPTRFKTETKEDKESLEQLSGMSVLGFRAPRFSLTPKSIWAVDILGELGFRYSSSVMSTNLSLFGFPAAPKTVFRWPNGLVEFPLPLSKLGSWEIPYLGGIYLYAMPSFMTAKCLTKADPNEILWTYVHPYDFDCEEKFALMPDTPAWISIVLFAARRRAEKKIRALLHNNTAAPLIERLPPYPLTTFMG